MLVVAKNDRKLRIEVGYGLEGALTDVTAKRIIDEIITPKFRTGDFAGGISAGVDRIIRVVDGETLPAPEPQHWQRFAARIDLDRSCSIRSSSSASSSLGGVPAQHAGPAARLGRAPAAWSALLAWFIVGSLVVSLIAASSRSFFAMFGDGIAAPAARPDAAAGPAAAYGGGSWSGGSSSSDSGGFSGGGGSFGGGGASGSW